MKKVKREPTKKMLGRGVFQVQGTERAKAIGQKRASMFEEELAGQCGWREIVPGVAEKDSGGEAKEVTGSFSCRPL